MTEQSITCIACPVGCDILVRGENDNISDIMGGQCEKGKEYARIEFTHPARTLTAVIRVNRAETTLIPVRSDKPIPRNLLLPCMELIKDTVVMAPISIYDSVIPNIMGTDVNIIATGTAL